MPYQSPEHHALLIVLAGVGQGTGDNLVPAIFGHVIVEVGEQALAGEQAGRGVALVVFRNVRSVVGVEDLGAFWRICSKAFFSNSTLTPVSHIFMLYAKNGPFAVWCGWVCQVVTVLRSSLPQVR